MNHGTDVTVHVSVMPFDSTEGDCFTISGNFDQYLWLRLTRLLSANVVQFIGGKNVAVQVERLVERNAL